jgi:hypothetical protein
MGYSDNGSELVAPPELNGWTAYCETCAGNRAFALRKEHDTRDRSVYFEYICDACYSILLTLTPPSSAS